MDLKIFGNHEENTIEQMKTCLKPKSAIKGVLCADGHLGYSQPVGGVIAYKDFISISGVGFDIGCGNLAVELELTKDRLKLDDIVTRIKSSISFGVGQRNNTNVEHSLFDSTRWKDAEIEELKDLARSQLGTVGSGNHYVDLFESDKGTVWIGVHFGSRGLGHKIATKYLALAGGKDGINKPPTLVIESSELGQRYLQGMTLAGDYANAGRCWVVEKVREILGYPNILTKVHNHHNFAWSEVHQGTSCWVIRKGATPAFPGQRSFIGGSMGDNAFIVKGVDSEASRESLYSTIHGAGRIMGRAKAKKTFTQDEMNEWLVKADVRLIGGDLDESPMAYRRLKEVLAYHQQTLVIEHELKPFLVFMAGKGEFDPYKD